MLVAGIAGALVAVPLAAAGNAVVQHLASYTEVGDDPEEALDDDLDAADEGTSPTTARSTETGRPTTTTGRGPTHD